MSDGNPATPKAWDEILEDLREWHRQQAANANEDSTALVLCGLFSLVPARIRAAVFCTRARCSLDVSVLPIPQSRKLQKSSLVVTNAWTIDSREVGSRYFLDLLM